MSKYEVWTDGGFYLEKELGTYGYVIVDDKDNVVFTGNGFELNVNSSTHAELVASISALTYCIGNLYGTFHLFCDNKTLIMGMNEWMDGWIKRGWKASNNKPPKCKELWQVMNEINQLEHITYTWVKGHDGLKYNEMAHKLAEEAYLYYKRQNTHADAK